MEEIGDFAMELNSFSVDRQVKEFVDKYVEGQQVDEYFW